MRRAHSRSRWFLVVGVPIATLTVFVLLVQILRAVSDLTPPTPQAVAVPASATPPTSVVVTMDAPGGSGWSQLMDAAPGLAAILGVFVAVWQIRKTSTAAKEAIAEARLHEAQRSQLAWIDSETSRLTQDQQQLRRVEAVNDAVGKIVGRLQSGERFAHSVMAEALATLHFSEVPPIPESALPAWVDMVASAQKVGTTWGLENQLRAGDRAVQQASADELGRDQLQLASELTKLIRATTSQLVRLQGDRKRFRASPSRELPIDLTEPASATTASSPVAAAAR
jgi:hypothetical protein